MCRIDSSAVPSRKFPSPLFTFPLFTFPLAQRPWSLAPTYPDDTRHHHYRFVLPSLLCQMIMTPTMEYSVPSPLVHCLSYRHSFSSLQLMREDILVFLAKVWGYTWLASRPIQSEHALLLTVLPLWCAAERLVFRGLHDGAVSLMSGLQ